MAAYIFDGADGKPVYGQIELFESIVGNAPLPLHLAPGNHDIECYRYVDGTDVPAGDQSVKSEARRAWKDRGGSYTNDRWRASCFPRRQRRFEPLFSDSSEMSTPAGVYFKKGGS